MEEVTLLLGNLTISVRGSLVGGGQSRPGKGSDPTPPWEGEDPAKKRSAATTEPEEESEALRCYTVTANPHDPTSLGIWCGPHPQCWRQLSNRLRGGQLFGSGATVHRHRSQQEAKERWLRTWHPRMPGTQTAPPTFRVA